jgi:hypothetical protein
MVRFVYTTSAGGGTGRPCTAGTRRHGHGRGHTDCCAVADGERFARRNAHNDM